MIIGSFDGQWAFLSNYSAAPTVVAGLRYPTAEHAYQAAKTADPEWQEHIRLASDPDEAKRLGRAAPHRADWDDVKLDLMREIVAAKFSSAELRERLLDTGDAVLIEGNEWGDTFWGVCGGVGANHMGAVLMELRAQLRDAGVRR